MELAFTIALGPWTLAQSTSTGLRLAPDALPIWAKEPRSDVAFHNAQISTVHGVLLYPILGSVARCGYPRRTARDPGSPVHEPAGEL